MIAINLARQLKAPKAKAFSQRTLISLGAGLAIVFLVLGTWWWGQMLQQQVDEMQEEKRVKTQRLVEMQQELDTLVQFEERTKPLVDSVMRLTGSRKDKHAPIEFLSIVSLNLQDKNIWLDSWKFENHSLTMRGFSLTVEDIENFMKALEESPIGRSVPMVSIEDPPSSTSKVFPFFIQFVYDEKDLV